MIPPVHPDLIPQVEKRHGVRVEKIKEFERHHKDPVLNLILDCAGGQRLFLKQVQPHSFRPELEEIYSRLSGLKPDRYRLVLPLADSSGQFIFEQDGIPFVVMKFEEMSPFSAEKIGVQEVLAIVSDFHEQVRDMPLPRQAHRTLEGWLRRGPEQIRKRFGDAAPFVQILEQFRSNRLPAFRFREGVIHWDIHPYNFGIDSTGQALLLDFDLLQPGALAFDIMRVVPMFREPREDEIRVPEEVLMSVHSALVQVVSVDSEGSDASFGLRDLRFLVGRCLMMEVWDWPEVDQRQEEVMGFLQAIENWVGSDSP
jgi:hypothetical protein